MSDNVTSIKKAWNAKTESVCIDLALLTQALENRKHTYASNNSIQAALTQEIEIVSNITQKVNSAAPIDSTYIKELEDKLTEIESIYNEQDAGAHDDFLNRRSTIRATISHTNKLMEKRPPEQNAHHSGSVSNIRTARRENKTPMITTFTMAMEPEISDILAHIKNNALTSIHRVKWDKTEDAAHNNLKLQALIAKEKRTISKIESSTRKEVYLTESDYKDIEATFTDIAHGYADTPKVLREFKDRQEALNPALIYILADIYKKEEYAPLNAIQRIEEEAPEEPAAEHTADTFLNDLIRKSLLPTTPQQP